jgi:hypothetical protein
MFQNFLKALVLIALVALVASVSEVPSFAESTSGNSVTIENVHCSGGEGFAVAMLTADPQASSPVAFSIKVDGVLYGDPNPEFVKPGDPPFGVSIGGLTPGTHTISVTADNFSFSQEIQIVCSPDTSGLPPVVVIQEGDNFGHHHHKHHKKHHHKHHAPAGNALPNTGK